MASKKRGGRGGLELDDDLDFDIPDFGGDSPEAMMDDRKPISSGLKAAAEGFGKTFTNEARLRKSLTKSLPREYEEPISKAFEIKDGVRDLYNSASTQTKEIVRESKISIGRIARNLEPALPKKLAERLKRMGDEAESGGSSGGTSKDEIEQGTIDSAMSSIFSEKIEADAEEKKKDTARGILQQRIDNKRHADMTQILGSIDQSLLKLSTFQDKEGTNYMKKALELQFRSYFVQADTLQIQKKFFEEFKNSLAAITKNTGLPDYVKKATKEALMEQMREKAFESLAGGISARRNKWLGGAFKKADDKISSTLGSIREGASAVLDTAESVSSMAGSGMGPSKEEVAGDIAGGWAGNKVQDKLAARVRKFAKNNPGIVKFGNKASQVATSLPQWVSAQMETGKYAHKFPDLAREILGVDEESSSIRLNREVDMDRAAQFSDKNSRSLNIVIPELLSKIHNELYMTRTGDLKAEPMAYDYESGKFVSKTQRLDDLKASIVTKGTQEDTRRDFDNIFDEIDPDKKIDPEVRKRVEAKIYGANKRNTYFDRESMMSYDVLGDDMDTVGKHVSEYVDRDKTGANERKLSKLFSKSGARNGEVKDLIQHLIDTGRQGELAETGLLKKGRIDLDMVRRMELGHDMINNPSSPPPEPPPDYTASIVGDKPKPPTPPTPTTPKTPVEQIAENESPENEQVAPSQYKGMTRRDRQRGRIYIGENKKKDETAAGDKKSWWSRKTKPEPDPNAIAATLSESSLSGISGAFKEALAALNGVKKTGGATEPCCERIEKAIQEATSKTELGEIRDILLRIEHKGLGGGNMTPEMFEAYMSDRPGFFGKAGKLAKNAFTGLMKTGYKSAKGFSTIGKAAIGKLTDVGKTSLNWLSKKKEKFDLFIEGEVEPRLSRAKLEAGKYIDAKTGKVIEKFEDIKGDIKDIDTDEIVLRGYEIKTAILKNLETGKQQLAKLTDWGKSAIKFGYDKVKQTASALIGGARSVYGMGWNALKFAYGKLTDGPMDVYLKDSYETPVLLKKVMEKGLYFDKETLEAITKVSDIKGAVVDNSNDVVLSKEDLHNGLYDKNGREIKTGFDRITQFVGNSIKKTIGSYRKLIGKAKDMGGKAMAWMKGLFGFDSPLTVFSRQTNDILTAIYNLLNDRMPGERSSYLDGGVLTAGSGKAAASADGGTSDSPTPAQTDAGLEERVATQEQEGPTKPKSKSDFQKLKDKFFGKVEEVKERVPKTPEGWKEARDEVTASLQRNADPLMAKLEEIQQTVNGKLTTVAGGSGDPTDSSPKAVMGRLGSQFKQKVDPAVVKLDELVALFRERMPEPSKKVAGDLNGDGVRDGSIDDLRKKREAGEEKEKKEGEAGPKFGKDGKSGWAALADLFGKKKKDEEEEGGKDGNGDTHIDLGDGDSDKDKKGKKSKKGKPRGKIGRGWDKLKDKLTPKGKGLGARGIRAAGRGLGAVARFGGRAALWGGRALLGGGLLSAGTMGALATGASAVGSAALTGLGAVASGVGAILASPVTVPALLLGGAAVGGYLAYKWLTKPEPKPIELIRLAQYGWKPNNLEAYKRMKSLEEQLKAAVSFKGDKASLNTEKFDIKKLMEIYDLDVNKEEHAKKFVDWFANRFRPVFLQHQALIKTLESPKPLEDVDSNKSDFKIKYVDQCLFPGSHYEASTSPFKDEWAVPATLGTVEKQIADAKALIEKEGVKKEAVKTEADKNAATAASTAKVKEALAKKEREDEEKKQKDDTVGVPKDTKGASAAATASNYSRLQAATAGANAGVPDAANKPAGMEGRSATDSNAGPTRSKALYGPGGDPNASPGGGALPAGMGGVVKSRPVSKPTDAMGQQVKNELLSQMPKHGITTVNQQAALLGNIEHESNFKPVNENMNYKPAQMVKVWPNRFPNIDAASAVAAGGPRGIANSVYGGRMGNKAPDDGWNYRGRGPIQITGKYNYEKISKLIGKDIVSDPDSVLSDPKTAAASAIGFWKLNPTIGKKADAGDFAGARRGVNGGNVGMEDALARTNKYLGLLQSGQVKVGGPGAPDTPPDAAPPGAVEPPKTAADKTATADAVAGLPSKSEQDKVPQATPTLVPSPKPTTTATTPPAAPTPPKEAPFVAKTATYNIPDDVNVANKAPAAPAVVPSPKPARVNPVASVANNPNVGPIPTTFQDVRPVSPSQLTQSPRPNYAPTIPSAPIPVARTVPAVSDSFYQRHANVNSGDSIKIMETSLEESKTQTGLLTRIAVAVESLPKALADAVAAVAPVPAAEAKPAPTERNNYNKPATPMASPSVAFRRQLAGTS